MTDASRAEEDDGLGGFSFMAAGSVLHDELALADCDKKSAGYGSASE